MAVKPHVGREDSDMVRAWAGRILVVDDERLICSAVSDILSNGGFLCQTASSAAEALQHLAASPFDCLVTDICMPGGDGIELMKQARAIDPDLEVILLTAVADFDPAVEALRAGASNYIVKPFQPENILHCVRRASEHRRLVIENRRYRTHLEETVAEQSERIQQQFLSATQSLAEAVDARDPCTHGHSERVAHLAWRVACRLVSSFEQCSLIHLAGLLHDIGKIGVPDAILRKAGPLDADEWRTMKAHPVVGGDIVGKITPPKMLIDGIVCHHEHWDGRGYPHGWAGEAIPLVGRILAVADAYDAMASDRPYRAAHSPETAMHKLYEARNKQFDAEIVDVALQALEDERVERKALRGAADARSAQRCRVPDGPAAVANATFTGPHGFAVKKTIGNWGI